MNLLRLTKYLLIINFKDFGFLFWTVFYPIALITIFMATTSNLGPESLSDIEMAVDKNYEYGMILDQIDFIKSEEMTEDAAKNALANEEIVGFVTSDGNLIVENSGFDSSILESVINQIHQTSLLGISPENFNYDTNFIKSTDMDIAPQVVMYYSTLAMISFYTIFTSMELITSMRPNLSVMGSRFSASPFKKSSYIIASSIASLLLGLLTCGLVIGFLMIFYQDDLFSNFPATFLIILAGNIAGLGLGFIIGLIPNININVKSVVPVVFIVGLAFLSGLMGPGLRTVLNQKLPIINELNPLAHVTDVIYRVNLMDSFEGYWTAVFYLIGITLVSCIITLVALRRKQYDSL